MEIHEKASQLSSKDFLEIKTKLIKYSERENRLDVNMLLPTTLKILGRDESDAMNLVEEIRSIVSAKIRKSVL
jgi:hypothetical protein